MYPTSEQLAVIKHDPTRNGRVLAGPGTGKSWTSVALVRRLSESHPDLRLRLLTFTRAATNDLAKKIDEAKLEAANLSTIHAFALSLLLSNSGSGNLPEPLRIPDSWETKELIRPDIARRLRMRQFHGTRPQKVAQLELELAARWESLDDNVMLLSDLEPELRNAYVGLWEHHRRVFGYTLLAELPFRAGNALEDLDLNLEPLDFLIVDEYQDLNEADIRLVKLFASRGVRVLAIGDDDQSIYGFRMAAPQGIRRFPEEFENCHDYALTISQRCGSDILNAATMLIEAAPERPRKGPLTFRNGAQPGCYMYLRFRDEAAEVNGVANLVKARIDAGVLPGQIAILVRSQVHTWADQVIPSLAERDVNAIDIDWVENVLKEPEVRRGLALIRLALHRDDSLAWWTLLRDKRGVAQSFLDYLYDVVESNETFGQALLRLHPHFPRAPTRTSAEAAEDLVKTTLAKIREIQIEGAQLGETGWGGWVIEQLDPQLLSDDAVRLFEEVGRVVPVRKGLAYFLGQLEPVGKDLATQSNAVRIMTITASKGLTVNTCVVMGVENGIIPHPRGQEEEERRLLYVAMTRATDMSVLTFANRRTGPTARQGKANVNRSRGRCPLFENLPIGEWADGGQWIEELRHQG